MWETAATAAAFATAAVLSFFLPRRHRWLLVVVVLLVPVATASPSFVRAERHDAAASAKRSQYSIPPPFKWQQRNPRLLKGIVARVPAHASVAVVNANLGKGWLRWVAYSIAPRQLVNVPTQWTIVFDETPARAGLHPAHAWHYGNDWLVER